MKRRLVPLLLVALVTSISSAQTPEPAAKLRSPVAVDTVARGASPTEERQDRYRQMKQRAAEESPDRYAPRREPFVEDDGKPIRRVSKEELWDYLDGPPPRYKSSSRDELDLERDRYLSDRDSDRDRSRSSSRGSSRDRRSSRDRAIDDEERASWRIGDNMRDWMDFDKPNGWLQSDRCFEGMATPISNPFYFEDPRSTTEIRPLFIYQKIPSPQPNFNGGNIWYLGTQVRLAFTERLSLTINKLGATAVNPGSSSLFGNNFGFSELWLGPKFTLIRDDEIGTLLAAGAQFQIPVGSGKVFQNTGSLSIVPYVSLAHPFLKTRMGTFNGLVNTGYSISTNKMRSDFYYLNAHTSFDLGNAQRFFPVAELTWTRYTTNGNSWPIFGEGRDLINFGGLAKGSSLLTGALGGRFRMTKNADIGAAFELPLAGTKDFFSHRFTVDFIWRY